MKTEYIFKDVNLEKKNDILLLIKVARNIKNANAYFQNRIDQLCTFQLIDKISFLKIIVPKIKKKKL